ncbi:MAG: hypothetical protein Q8R35_03615 [bacterium]|nr:hypothetical protein [bacterium]
MEVEWAVRNEDGIPAVEFRIEDKDTPHHSFTDRMFRAFTSDSLQSALRDTAWEFHFNDDPRIAELEPLLASLSAYLGVLEGMGYPMPRLVMVRQCRGVCTFLIKPALPVSPDAAPAGQEAHHA